MSRPVNALSKTTKKAVLLASWLAVLARILVIVALIGTVVAVLHYEIWTLLYLVLLSAVVVVWGGYLGLAISLRCPACRQHFFIEKRGPKHAAARKAQYFDYWGTTVLDIIRRREFTCMYCGEISYLR
jgi:hypothetical protein